MGAAALVVLASVPEIVAGQAIPAASIATIPAPILTPVRYSIKAVPDGVIFGAATLLAAVPALAGSSLPYATCAPCDSTKLWSIDRSAIGLPRSGIGQISTVTMGATLVGAGALVALSRHGEPEAGRAGREDMAILLQAVELDFLATDWAKVLFHRARPVLYTSLATQNQTIDAGRSLPSGHASFSFAAAAAAASILHRRGELGRHKVPVILLFAGAVTTSALRVAAHKHFPTDVAAGALLGTAIGWFVPQLHPIH